MLHDTQNSKVYAGGILKKSASIAKQLFPECAKGTQVMVQATKQRTPNTYPKEDLSVGAEYKTQSFGHVF